MIIIRFVMAVFCDQPSRVTLGIFRKEKGCNRKKYKRAARGSSDTKNLLRRFFVGVFA